MKQNASGLNRIIGPRFAVSAKTAPLQRKTLALMLGLLLGGAPAQADTITVINTDDSGPGSLRQAIDDAFADDTIAFDPSLSGATITLSSELIINKNLIIDGDIDDNGRADIRISGNQETRIFTIDDGVGGATINVTLQGLTLSHGYIADGILPASGGGLTNFENLMVVDSTISGSSAALSGGAIANTADLYIDNSTLLNNVAENGGGAIDNTGTVTIMDSTLSNNSAMTAEGGGAILNLGIAYIINSTLSANYSAQSGGGIYNEGDLTVTNSTLANNQAVSGGGIYHDSDLGSGEFNNNIIALNTGTDCVSIGSGVLTLGNNLIETESGGCTGTLTSDPKLGPLQDNGGFTLTHNPMDDSPAIDAGINADAVDSEDDPLINDQRGTGFARIVGGVVDLGAVEYKLPSVVICLPNRSVISNEDFNSGNTLVRAETGIQVKNTVNVLQQAELNLLAPINFISEGFHAQSGSILHIKAMPTICP